MSRPVLGQKETLLSSVRWPWPCTPPGPPGHRAGVGGSPLPCHLLRTSAGAPAPGPPEAAGCQVPHARLSPGAGYRRPGGPALCLGPWRTQLSGSGQWPSSALLPGRPPAPASVHRPRLGQPRVDSGRRRLRGAGTPGRASSPENTSRLSPPPPLPGQRPPRGHGGGARRSLAGSGAQLPLRPPPPPGRGAPSLCGHGRWRDKGRPSDVREEKEDTTEQTADLEPRSPRSRGGRAGGGRRPALAAQSRGFSRSPPFPETV